MKKRLVISSIPAKLPINSTILYAFLLHYYNVSDLWWGIFITLWSFYWILVLYIKFNEKAIDINNDIKDNVSNNKNESEFSKRLRKACEARNI